MELSDHIAVRPIKVSYGSLLLETGPSSSGH